MRKTLTAIAALLLVATASARADLVAHFPFDGDVADATGNGNDGTFFGDAAGPTYVAGHDGADAGAVLFDGSNDYVQVTQADRLPITGHTAFTVAMWVNAAVQRDKRIFSEGSSASNTPIFNLGTHNTGANGLFNRFLRPGPGHQRNSIDLYDGTWKHVTYVDDDGAVTVYIDGVRDTANLDYTRQLTGLNRTSIGGILRGGPCCHFAGAIDEVRLYDHALSQAEVRELVPTEGCPEEGDTHCGGVEVVAAPVGGGAGRYTLAVSATDDSGDAMIFDIDVADAEGNSVSSARSESATLDLLLGEGTWTVTVTADDDLKCDDAADDATCVIEITVDPEPLCVSHWALDGDLGDSGPGGNDGTWIDPDASGETYVDGFDGSAGGALYFDGVDDLVSFTQNSGLPIYANSAYTVTMWVRGATGQVDRRVFSEGSTTSGVPLLNIGTHSGGLDSTLDIYIRRGDTLVGHAHSARGSFDDTWHHIAFVDDNGRCTMYIDGVRDSTMPAYTRMPLVNMNTTTIGGILRANASHWFNGAIDDVRVYNHALDGDAIVAMVPDAADCDGESDTSCNDLFITAPAGQVGGNWTFTAEGSDAGGDAALSYTFELFDSEGGLIRQAGPSDVDTVTFNLMPGEYNVTATIDDRLDCFDEPASVCSRDVTVNNVPLFMSRWAFDDDLLDTGNIIGSEDSPGNNGSWMPDEPPVFAQGHDCAQSGAISVAGDGAGDDIVLVTAALGLPLWDHGAFTISMWVRGEPQRDKRIWSESNASGNNNTLFNLGSGNTADTEDRLDLYLRDNGGSAVQGNHVKSTQTVFDGTWHHVCWVDDAGDVTLYVDGVEDGTDFDYTRPTLTVDTTTIGGILRAGGTCCEFAGDIDEVRVFNFLLDAEDVEQLCSETAPQCCPSEGDADFADTHCDGLDVNPTVGGGATPAGLVGYEINAFASDDSGDDVSYVFQATADGHEPLSVGPQAASTVALELAAGATWTITVTVDDDPDCDDAAADSSCETVLEIPPPCPREGDTHCTGLDVIEGFGSVGRWIFSASATDDSGDAVIYTFFADNGHSADPTIVIGPQASNEISLHLDAGDWTIAVGVDDDPECPDVADDFLCEIGIEVRPAVGPFRRGDVDASGVVELTDGINLLSFLFLGGEPPPCFAAANANRAAEVELTTAVYIFSFLFLGGAEPPPPFAECGYSENLSDMALGCEAFPPCE